MNKDLKPYRKLVCGRNKFFGLVSKYQVVEVKHSLVPCFVVFNPHCGKGTKDPAQKQLVSLECIKTGYLNAD